MKLFHLPDLGEGLQEAEIVTWHVVEGERVVADQPLVSVETDKAVVEVPSPYSGVITSLNAKEGEIIAVGAVLVEYGGEEAERDAGTVVGSVTQEEPDNSGKSAPTKPAAAPRPAGRAAKASPAVRALARKLGVALETIKPSGPHGNVTSADVRQAAQAGIGTGATGEGEPLRGMRRAMAQRMSESHSRVVPVSVHDEADIGAWTEGTDITVRAIRALVAGCAAEPALNVWFDDEARTILSHKKVNLGVAVDSPEGLFVPVLPGANEKSAAEIRINLADLIEKVKARSVPPEDLRGATITLSNYGALGVRFAQMVVVPPQVAIIGIGKMREDTVVLDGEVRVSRVLPISATFDHRVVTGGEGARFLSAFIDDLQQVE